MFRKLYVLLLLIVPFYLYGQPNNFRFHSYNPNELNAKTVYSIVEDSLDFIWLGTDNGLKRFDGYEFKDYLKNTVLEGEEISELKLDSIGNIWIASSSGVFVFDRDTENLISIYDQYGIDNLEATALEFQNDNVWVGTYEGLYLLRKDGTHQLFTTEAEKALKDDEVFDLMVDRKGNLLISTDNGGLSVLDHETGIIRTFLHDEQDATSISSNRLRYLAEGPDGQVLIGTRSDGLNLFDLQTETFKNYVVDPSLNPEFETSAYSILVDNENKVWVGTWANGLNIVDLGSGKVVRYSEDPSNPYAIPNNFVISIFQSSGGDIWFGTHEAGLFRFSPIEQRIVRYQHDNTRKNTLSTNFSRSVYEDKDGFIWMGTGQGGLNRYNPKNDEFKLWLKSDGSRDAMARGTIWSISETTDGRYLWLGTSRGIGKLDKQSGSISFMEPDEKSTNAVIGNNVLKVMDDHNGTLWAGSWYGGLNKLDLATGRFSYYGHDETDPTSIAANNINDIFIDSQKRVWVATSVSFSQFVSEEQGFINYPYITLMIAEDKQGFLWICTPDGLLRVDPEKAEFAPYGVKDGFSSNNASSVLIDEKNNLWLYSISGVDCFSLGTKKVSHLGVSDGLASTNTVSRAAHIGPSGKIYFGSHDGLSVIDPQKISSRQAPQLLLTELLLSNKAVSVSDSTVLLKNIESSERLTLDYSDYIFALEFAAIEFQGNDEVNYFYRLNGFDKNWITTDFGNRKAVYTNVPPGNYTFEVRVEDIYHRWEPVESSIQIAITPPWWKTMLAKVSFAGFGMLLIFLFIQARTSRINRQKKLLEKEVLNRTSEIENQKKEIEIQASELSELNKQKNELIGIISHDVRSPLASLKSIAELLDPKILTEEDLERLRDQMKNKLDGVSGSIHTLLEWAIDQMEGESTVADTFDINTVINEIVQLFEVAVEEKGIALESKVNKGTLVLADPNQIRVVVRNLIGNAIKFTDSGDTITVLSTDENDKIVIQVKDTGVGMEPERIEDLFSGKLISSRGTLGEKGTGLGLELVKNFVEKNDGTVWVESEVNKGTTFYFSLPRGRYIQ